MWSCVFIKKHKKVWTGPATALRKRFVSRTSTLFFIGLSIALVPKARVLVSRQFGCRCLLSSYQITRLLNTRTKSILRVLDHRGGPQTRRHVNAWPHGPVWVRMRAVLALKSLLLALIWTLGIKASLHAPAHWLHTINTAAAAPDYGRLQIIRVPLHF